MKKTLKKTLLVLVAVFGLFAALSITSNAKTVNKGSLTSGKRVNVIDYNSYYQNENYKNEYKYKITVKKAGIATFSGCSNASFYGNLCNSKGVALSTYSHNISNTYGGKLQYAVKKGTYYFKFKVSSFNQGYASIGYVFSTGSISNKKTITNYSQDRNQYFYYKFKASTTGVVTFTAKSIDGSDSAYMYTALTNAKKIRITDEDYSSTTGKYSYDRSATYGVKKGVTYYLRVKASSPVKIACVNKSVKSNCGSKFSQAKSVKSGKYTNGTFILGNKETDWYKFSTSKNTIKFKFDGDFSGKLIFTIYNSNGDAVTYDRTIYGDSLDYAYKYSSVKKGTYYIRVRRASSSTTGLYKMRVDY
ncbi:hypothetical protein SAMN05216249_101146 [Acetitomaculum ruminis DSM 5522]|uniref:Pre-peptidase C-terminal domain-containing protein n=1 Tax=Acetitomaculum ruminis DSM 5522 TaxID=1120918 RepID=A0A1I0V5Z4_9FIRM|nr:hypothetical protein [Acetitomaculum ruminis]SFA70966.1 hypothetical protein SAMN05216249_101146 [Acetitomaculum ruminis DSM 5522]